MDGSIIGAIDSGRHRVIAAPRVSAVKVPVLIEREDGCDEA